MSVSQRLAIFSIIRALSLIPCLVLLDSFLQVSDVAVLFYVSMPNVSRNLVGGGTFLEQESSLIPRNCIAVFSWYIVRKETNQSIEFSAGGSGRTCYALM